MIICSKAKMSVSGSLGAFFFFFNPDGCRSPQGACTYVENQYKLHTALSASLLLIRPAASVTSTQLSACLRTQAGFQATGLGQYYWSWDAFPPLLQVNCQNPPLAIFCPVFPYRPLLILQVNEEAIILVK